MTRILIILLLTSWLASCSTPDSGEVVITLMGTNDVHGQLLAAGDRGGLTAISAFVNAIRVLRNADGGAVLLIDAGDMWQGTLESNLSEGASVVEAYNALGYVAAAIGNHEFDFGPVGPAPIPVTSADDPRGALKQRAREADFPFLAANLVDLATGELVAWDNVQPSIMVEAAGIKIGIIGVMTENALTTAIAANTIGLRVTPLAGAITREARALREAGATIVVVAAHAGGQCTEFGDPTDTSSCNLHEEIFRVANALPEGLVDHIFAGHVHQGIAHTVNGISITSSYSRTVAFSRVDMIMDRSTGTLVGKTIFPPTKTEIAALYEGVELIPDPELIAIASNAASSAAAIKQEKIGIYLETPFVLTENPESALGNLYTDALLASVDADIAMHLINGGIRADLPAGDLTFGSIYEMSPFDNRITIIELTGAELRQVIAEQAHRGERRVNFSGMHVLVECAGTAMSVDMKLLSGREIQDTDTVSVALVDYLALGGDRVLASVTPDGGFVLNTDYPLARDAVVDWLRARGGSINASDFLTEDDPKWRLPNPLDSECRFVH